MMIGLDAEWENDQTAGTASGVSLAPVFIIVGFDGSEPAQRALDSAAKFLQIQNGELDIVYVAQLPATASLSADAVGQLRRDFDDQSRQLGDEVRTRLEGTEPRWHFERRDGRVVHELMAVADEVRQRRGPDANIIAVVGRSSHAYHRVLGSVSLALVRDAPFPVVVVP
jgi:nucleotide-binding universal stress UspA family protein